MTLERFEGKVAIVTGAASGIGRATAVRLAEEGATVLAVDVDEHGLEVTAKDHGGIHTHVADVGDEAAVGGTVRAAVEPFGRLDVLANIAGIMRTAHTHECPTELWDLVIRVNLTGTFLMCREALPHLLETKGTIVNCASTASPLRPPVDGGLRRVEGRRRGAHPDARGRVREAGRAGQRHRAGQRRDRDQHEHHVPGGRRLQADPAHHVAHRTGPARVGRVGGRDARLRRTAPT